MLMNFPESIPEQQKLQVLLAYHKLPIDFKVDEEVLAMVVMALNQDDIITATIDEEGQLDIEYSGDEWQNQEFQYHQEPIQIKTIE
jgi:hypothetical protein